MDCTTRYALFLQAVALGQYLVNSPDIVRNKKVLELGAGTGLAGIVAARIGRYPSHETQFVALNQNFSLVAT